MRWDNGKGQCLSWDPDRPVRFEEALVGHIVHQARQSVLDDLQGQSTTSVFLRRQDTLDRIHERQVHEWHNSNVECHLLEGREERVLMSEHDRINHREEELLEHALHQASVKDKGQVPG